MLSANVQRSQVTFLCNPKQYHRVNIHIYIYLKPVVYQLLERRTGAAGAFPAPGRAGDTVGRALFARHRRWGSRGLEAARA